MRLKYINLNIHYKIHSFFHKILFKMKKQSSNLLGQFYSLNKKVQNIGLFKSQPTSYNRCFQIHPHLDSWTSFSCTISFSSFICFLCSSFPAVLSFHGHLIITPVHP